MFAAARNKAILHHFCQSKIQASFIKLCHYSREWNEWKNSEERTLFLQRNERRLVDVTRDLSRDRGILEL